MKDRKHYSIRIEGRLYNRITNHLRYLKRQKSLSYQGDWIKQAIIEKLRKEEKQPTSDLVSIKKCLNFDIDDEMDKEIEKRIEIFKELGASISKQKWVIEAIEEKLNLEEQLSSNSSHELFENVLKKVSAKSSNEAIPSSN